MTTFQDRTIADLQDKIRALREVLSSHEAEASHHRERHNYYQGLASRSRADLDDYECLLGYAETVNANEVNAEGVLPARPDVASMLTELQSNGLACSRCGLLFLKGQSSRPTGTGSHGQLFAHANLSDCAEVAS